MKIVLNKCYGGFGLDDELAEKYKLDEWSVDRTDEKLIELVEKYGEDAGGSHSELEIVEIPDEATDWEIDEYDGFESVIYVVDGKIYHA